MKVFIVHAESEWSGCEFYDSEAVFSTREAAEQYAKENHADAFRREPKNVVQEFEVNE